MNALQLGLALLLAFVLPGYALMKAIWPRRAPMPDQPFASRLFFTLLLSVSTTVLVGALLGFIPHAEGTRGYFQGAATGAPYLEAALLSATAAFFLAGLLRGAYPRLRRVPQAEPEPSPEAPAENPLAARIRALARPGEEDARRVEPPAAPRRKR